jgi:cytochrome c peroxidase
MKYILVLLAIITAIFSLSMVSGEKKINLEPAIQTIADLSEEQVQRLDSFLLAYPGHFYDSDHATRQKKYEELAYYFKRAANFIIYYEPTLYYEKLIGPFQFQKNARAGILSVVPDNWLFTGPIGNEADSNLKKFYTAEDSINQKAFIIDIAVNYRKVIAASNYKVHLSGMNESELFDALRVEIFRISSIDIANGDFIVEDAGMPSLNGSVDSWLLFTGTLVKQLPKSREGLKLQYLSMEGATKKYLHEHTDFKSFDRMHFIKNHLIPLSSFLNELQVVLKVPFVKKSAALRSNAKHLYDQNVFVADFFAPNEDAKYSVLKAKLGELLFFDPLLSGNNKRACASCHKPDMAFTDGKEKSVGFEFEEVLSRNSPTVINAGFQKKLFWDQRAGSLEDQLDSVVNNSHELNGSFTQLVEKLVASPEYVSLFNKAFPETIKKGIRREDIKNAIGVYERTVTGLNSRFDQYMQGDATKLSPEEVKGFNLYMGKARCGTCHFAPLFNGAVPPFYEITDHKSLGVPIRDTMEKYRIDPDEGMITTTGNAFTRFSFKTPTVRNSALTAPYMHNGVYKTLEQVVNFYDHAAGEKLRKDMRQGMKDLPFFTIIPLELKLTDPEKKALVAFIKALDDTSASHTPKRLPQIKGKYAKLNDRVIGGEY